MHSKARAYYGFIFFPVFRSSLLSDRSYLLKVIFNASQEAPVEKPEKERNAVASEIANFEEGVREQSHMAMAYVE